MKYTKEEMVSEILKRSDKVRNERKRRTVRCLGAASAALFAALVIVIGVMPAGMSGTYAENTRYGAFLLGHETGGYVLAAVIAFVLGVTVTLLALKRRGSDSRSGPEDK